MSRWQFWIDVGGTFTDCVAKDPTGTIRQHKTLSSGAVKGVSGRGSGRGQIVDPARSSDPDHVWQGYALRTEDGDKPIQVDRFENGILYCEGSFSSGISYELTSRESAPLLAIRYLLGCAFGVPLPPVDVRLGTTRGTNALITRSGNRTGLVATRGFRDFLRIGYQTRPDLFALDIQKPDELYEEVVEIDERITANGKILSRCGADSVHQTLSLLLRKGIDSLAVVLLHACANPAHEIAIGKIADELGFANVSLSHEISSLRKLVPRGDTTVIDAYLNPILHSYVDGIQRALHPGSTLQLMTSSGGLVEAKNFRGRDSILSGPAGGVVGVARAAQQGGFERAIGFDMGGTSTDVSRWDGEFELEFETKKAGVRVVTPMMAIETVAAGGGSICQFDGVKLTVGPESAGASPGPACYGAGGPLAVTDINFFLGKILPAAFPFSLDRDAVERALGEQGEAIYQATGKRHSLMDLADGYLRVANAHMAEAIRCVSVERGVDPREHAMVAFGGAAPQHACAVATELGIDQILLHPQAGILSAYGIGLASVTTHHEQGIYAALDTVDQEQLERTFAALEREASDHLGLDLAAVESTRYLDLRFAGLDEPIRVRCPGHGDFKQAYESAFRAQSGYLPTNRSIEVVTARVTAAARQDNEAMVSTKAARTHFPLPVDVRIVCFAGEETEAGIYRRDQLKPGDQVVGPAIVTEVVSTIVVDPGWQAEVMTRGELLLEKVGSAVEQCAVVPPASANADPVLLEVFNNRFSAIATQMGSVLRKTSRSVNVKERLDYSCAIFTPKGNLVVNAPHIPVHLGAMSTTVQRVLEETSLLPGDVVVTNDPYRGGSHLPDVTLITPVHDDAGDLLFLVASRAHHAEIGGIAPGSMPPNSKCLEEEGVLIRAMKVVDAGRSRLPKLQSLLEDAPYPSRDADTNLADVAAQIAANRHGATNLLRFIQEYSWHVVSSYMTFIQEAAERKTRAALARLPDGHRRFLDHLDDGSQIALTLSIEGDSATMDFTGTGDVLKSNLNANQAIVTAATLYCMRLMVNEDIPLNQGVLAPIRIILPPGLLNPPADDDPSACPAIVGGNVETSQRIVDVVLGAFGAAAASQGTMNNFLFGNDDFGYYETICGGAGATANACGADAVHTHMTNTRLTDPEVLESRFPVRLRRFEIRTGSGGRGNHRGGDGVIREIEFLAPLQVSLLTQRRGDFAPYGMLGGESGRRGMNALVRKGGRETDLGGNAHLRVEPGDVIRVETPGGGGWGKEGQS